MKSEITRLERLLWVLENCSASKINGDRVFCLRDLKWYSIQVCEDCIKRGWNY